MAKLDRKMSQWPHRTRPESFSKQTSSATSDSVNINPENTDVPAANTNTDDTDVPATNTNADDTDVPATNLDDTAQLWSEVMATVTGRRSEIPRPPKKRGQKQLSAPESEAPSAPEWDDGASSAPSGATTTTTGKIYASPYDPHFNTQVLPAYGLSYFFNTEDTYLLDFYGDRELLRLVRADDQELDEQERSLKTNIVKFCQLDWFKNQHSVKLIEDSYYAMGIRELNEAEYMDYALEAIFCAQRIPHPVPGDEKLVMVRLLEYACKPEWSDLWAIPPLLGPEPPKKYLWDIHPDCLFAFSIQAFKPEFFSTVSMYVPVFAQYALCAYMSIEFKKTLKGYSERTARNRLIVTSTLQLYNRYRLKYRARKNKQWSVDDYKQLRHYGIAFKGSMWTVYCTAPKTPLWDKIWCTEPDSTPKPYNNNEELEALSWTGCEMRRIATGYCQCGEGTSRLLAHLSSIHLWGLYTHAESCRKDILEISKSVTHISFEEILKLMEGVWFDQMVAMCLV